MKQPIVCKGAPRDQGQSQGVQYRHAVRDWTVRVGADSRRSFLSALRPLTAGPVLGTGVGREVLRHHPHIAERMDGLARGAGLPLSSLMELVIPGRNRARISGAAACDADAHVAAISGGASAGLLRSLPAHPAPGCQWLLRRSLPEIGFRSVEVTLPWHASCVAGVNERGLAIAITPEPERAAPFSFAPPAVLLVQDCLQRFADLESALEWCAGRPAAPGVSITVSDESGDCASAVLTQDGCRVRRTAPDQELLVVGGSSESAAALRKRLDSGETPASVLADGEPAGVLHLDPKSRSLSVVWRDVADPVVLHASGDDGELLAGNSAESS